MRFQKKKKQKHLQTTRHTVKTWLKLIIAAYANLQNIRDTWIEIYEAGWLTRFVFLYLSNVKLDENI